jgi:twitching motility protein PilJ
MAGEAGRGFAVVADEVQRLAERSATATKQIAGLVKTIQNDTHEAVASMEQTTAEVVKGAELANSAGVALEEIETVSTNLAELIQDISEAAKHQATTSSHISNTMNVIQEITSQTLSGTNDTAASIGDLAEMAVEMRESITGFILPDDTSPEQTEPLATEDDYLGIEDLMPASEEGGAELTPDDEVETVNLIVDESPDQGLEQESLDEQQLKTWNKDTQDSDDEDPFHLEEFEAEIEALLTDSEKRR